MLGGRQEVDPTLGADGRLGLGWTWSVEQSWNKSGFWVRVLQFNYLC